MGLVAVMMNDAYWLRIRAMTMMIRIGKTTDVI